MAEAIGASPCFGFLQWRRLYLEALKMHGLKVKTQENVNDFLFPQPCWFKNKVRSLSFLFFLFFFLKHDLSVCWNVFIRQISRMSDGNISNAKALKCLNGVPWLTVSIWGRVALTTVSTANYRKEVFLYLMAQHVWSIPEGRKRRRRKRRWRKRGGAEQNKEEDCLYTSTSQGVKQGVK